MEQLPSTLRFGPYELRRRTRQLYKGETKLKLRPQPFQILQLLAVRTGDLVTREELRALLWPSDTFVDFEHGLNTSIKELRAALNDSASEPRFIETLPKLGYRLIVPVSVEDGAPRELGVQSEALVVDTAVMRQTPAVVARQSSQWRRSRVVLAVSSVLLAVGLGGYSLWSRSRVRAQAVPSRLMLAVLPFENLTGDPAQEYFSDGLTEEMIAQLGRLDPPRLSVIARTSVVHYKGSKAPLETIRRELGVQYVLEGSVRRDADKIRISAQLIQMRDQTHLWARQYDRELRNVLALQGEIAQDIAGEIQAALGEKKHALPAPPVSLPASYDAYDLYLEGRYFWNKRTKEGFQRASDYFQQATARDPNFARAYAGLADTYGLMSTWALVPQGEFMPKARAAALRALELDENLAEAHTSLALVAENFDYDWQGAEKEFKRAIQLDPSYATAHQWYAEYLSWQGRFDEALAESERARQLDPLSIIIASDHAVILYHSRQYDRAIAQARAVLEMDRNAPSAEEVLLYSYVQERRFVEAEKLVSRRETPSDEPWLWVNKARVYGPWGRTSETRQALVKLERFHWKPEERTLALLPVYAATGRKEQAIALLQKAIAEHSNAITSIKVDPIYDPLRGDPRFEDSLRRIGLSP